MIPDDTATHDPRDAPSSVADQPPTDTLESRYRIDRVIASGGMGVVVGATHKHLGTRVAIKLLHEASDDMRQRFLREAKLAARFDSPYVARVRDYGFSADGQPFLVMDHLEGRTLKARIDAGAVEPAEALRLGREIAAALIEVHKARIVHRDIKPSNIFLVRDAAGVEHVKLIDFGIAKRIAGDDGRASEAGITRSGEILGTVAYMAAEQMRGSLAVDHRADIFSVGAVLYEMLTGRRAFDSASRGYALAMSAGKQDATFLPLGSFVQGLDPVLEAVVTRCLSFDPAARFQSAEELLGALPSELATTDRTTTAAAVSARPRPSGPRVWAWATAIVAVVSVGAVAAWAIGRTPTAATEAPAVSSTSAASEAASAGAEAKAPLVVPEASASAAIATASVTAVASETAVLPRVRVPAVRPPKPSAKPRFDERQ